MASEWDGTAWQGEATKAVRVTDENDTQMSWPLGAYDFGAWQQPYQDVGISSSLRIVTVYACVRVLAETVASLPLLLYQRLPAGGKDRFPEHPLYDVLHEQPNPEMTSFIWRETMMGHLLTWGNAYNELSFDSFGRPQIWPIRPDRMEVSYENGRKVYDYLSPEGRLVRMKAGSVFHIPGLGSNGLKGYSPIQLHRDALALYSAAQSYGTNLFRNNARPAIVLSHPKSLSGAGIERLQAQFEQLKGSANAGKTVVLEEGLTITEVGIPPEDAQYIETRKFQMQEIARMYRVPPHMIGDLERATFSNIEHQSIDFVVHSLRPWLVRIEQEIKAQLLFGEPRVSAEFLVDGLLRGDSQARATSLNILRNAGIINADEWRAIENLNPLPDGEGEGYWMPMNMKIAGAQPEPEPEPEPQSANGSTPFVIEELAEVGSNG